MFDANTTPNSEAPRTSLFTSHKRKRGQSPGSNDPLTPSNSYTDVRSPKQFVQDTIDVPNLGLLIPSLPRPYQKLSDLSEEQDVQLRRPSVLKDQKTYFRIAQLLADQIVQQHANVSNSFSTLLSPVRRRSQASESQSDLFISALLQTIPGAKPCDLKQFAEIVKEAPTTVANSSSLNTGKPVSVPSQSTSSLDDHNKPFMINTPLVRVRRMQAQIDISTSALPFWEELGLAPASNEKNVMAFCICPKSTFVKERVLSFLESVGSAYQSCKLGIHQLGFDSTCHDDALVSVPASTDRSKAFVDNVIEACGNLGENLKLVSRPYARANFAILGRKLAASKVESTNFVIYMVNASTNPTSLPRLCEAFLHLSESYASLLKEQKVEASNDVLLHILPLDTIASNEKLVITGPAAYKKVAFEVYNRCAPLEDIDDLSPFSCAPAVQLARTIARTINLQLTSTPVAGLPHSDRCIHVGYYWDLDAQWLSASWTDSQGNLQWNACYCIATNKSQNWPTLQEAAKEVWDTTMDLINSNIVPWRVFIAKASRMSRQESDSMP